MEPNAGLWAFEVNARTKASVVAKTPISRFTFFVYFFLLILLFTWRVVSGEREFSCVLCACQEIVNFIFFLHLSTLCKRAYPRYSRTGEPEHTAKTLKTSFIHSFYRIESASFHANDSGMCVSAGAP